MGRGAWAVQGGVEGAGVAPTALLSALVQSCAAFLFHLQALPHFLFPPPPGALGQVFDVAISSDGCLAATVSDDFTCRVWDLDEEECLHVLEGHTGW